MKKLLILVFVFAFAAFSSSAFAGRVNDNAGCGVGTLIMDAAGQSNGGWLLQSTANWTNAILSDTLSMTTGTINCKGSINEVVNIDKAYEFVGANMDDFARDAAMGQGETIDSLAAILAVSDVDAFGANIQSHFSEIFPDANVQAGFVVDKIVEING